MIVSMLIGTTELKEGRDYRSAHEETFGVIVIYMDGRQVGFPWHRITQVEFETGTWAG